MYLLVNSCCVNIIDLCLCFGNILLHDRLVRCSLVSSFRYRSSDANLGGGDLSTRVTNFKVDCVLHKIRKPNGPASVLCVLELCEGDHSNE